MSNNYEDEIDLYGDAEEPQQQQQRNNAGSSSNNNSNNNASSSIPTFISEARGGTGVIPMRDDERNRAGSSDGFAPRNGDYGQPGQWQTKPISTVRPSDMPEEGKMFVGGLNWETTEESMKAYFEQFGEVTHCTIMRDPQTNRSRGFGFLTFREAAAVNVVMVKEHHLDGKIIDPKRAIPRPDVGTVRSDKVFVRHVPQSMDVYKFKEYFSQYGAIVDSNLMFDRETGMHRGFGFVTYEDPSSVSTALSQRHEWDGQELEVKMATQKRNREDTYVGDRPLHRRQQFDNRHDGGMGGGNQMMGNQMGGNGMGMNMGGNGMGGMGMGMQGGGMGNMGNMGGMGMQGGMGQQGGFDPFAMAQFFKQMGWGQFNPMMLMNGGMGGGAGNGMMDQSMMNPMMAMMGGMGGMNNNMMGGGMGNMGNPMGAMGGGAQSPSGSGFGEKMPPSCPRAQSSSTGRMTDNKPPANAPTGPRGGSAAPNSSGAAPSSSSGTGPMRNQRNQASGSAGHHPYR